MAAVKLASFAKRLAASTPKFHVEDAASDALALSNKTLGRMQVQAALTVCAIFGFKLPGRSRSMYCSKAVLLGSALGLLSQDGDTYSSRLTKAVAAFCASSFFRDPSHASSALCLLAAVFFLKHRAGSTSSATPTALIRGILCILNALVLTTEASADDSPHDKLLRTVRENHEAVMKKLGGATYL